MEDFKLLAPLLLAIVGLLAGAILKSILKRTGFPYTVGLFVFGCTDEGAEHESQRPCPRGVLWSKQADANHEGGCKQHTDD